MQKLQTNIMKLLLITIAVVSINFTFFNFKHWAISIIICIGIFISSDYIVKPFQNNPSIYNNKKIDYQQEETNTNETKQKTKVKKPNTLKRLFIKTEQRLGSKPLLKWTIYIIVTLICIWVTIDFVNGFMLGWQGKS